MTAYFVLGTPRSRTAWLAGFLSTEERPCLHEPTRTMGSLEDLTQLLLNPEAAVSDSLLSLRWRHIVGLVPEARLVVVWRPIGEVVASFGHLGVHDRRLVPRLLRLMAALEALSGAAAALWVPYASLEREATCALVYGHCLGVSMPPGRWDAWQGRNVQADLARVMREGAANAAGMRRLYPEMTEDI